MACYQWRTEDVTPQVVLATGQVATLRVTRLDGSRVVLERPLLQGDTLLGDTSRVVRAVRVPLTDIRHVETRRFSGTRTVGLGLGVAAGLTVALAVLYSLPCDCHR
jgi:hypothetical protein